MTINDTKKYIKNLHIQNNSLKWGIEKLSDINKLLMLELAQEKAYTKELQEEIEILRTISARVTAYAPFDNISGICADNNPYSTSTGKFPGSEYAAADPLILPYGTMLNIPGYGTVEIQDTGGALRGKSEVRIDVFMETHEEAIAWGVKWLDIKLK